MHPDLKHLNHYYLLVLIIVFTSCQPKNTEKPIQNAMDAITADDIGHEIGILASDSLQGRKPFSVGEERTIRYISNHFKELGIPPGNGDTYFQEVPLVEITSTPDPAITLKGKQDITLQVGTDFVASTRREQDSVVLTDSPLVFAGFGIVAPEYDWNDYEGLDVKGKTVVVLINDPGFNSGDSTLFKGEEMTYYGRWTYKYEEAARQGAEGLIIVHQTKPASYPWSVIQSSFQGSQLHLQAEDKHMSRCKMEGFITYEVAQKLMEASGIDGDFTAMARKNDFKAIPLPYTLSLKIKNTLKSSMSHNVIATMKGSERPDEYIIYTAHWDHLGVGAPVEGDSIYNGAVDNASGVAAMFGIARAFKALDPAPKRSIVFLAVTAEEQGLLGSQFYAENPVYPLKKTVADINMDALGDYGPTKDMTIIGLGQSEMEDYAEAAAKEQGRHLVPDNNPGAGHFYRSDHFNFAKVGVPALYAESGTESVEHGPEWGQEQQEDYVSHRYHQPSDEYSADLDVTGMVDDARLFFRVGYQLSAESTFPQWKKGSEFKATREKYMK